MTLSEFQEELVKLFLRLNGYITTGLIIHSEIKGKNKTQIDLIAVRFPFHNQDDRMVEPCNYLQIPTSTIDIIIGEVKGGKVKNQFNSSLRDDHDAIEKLVKWIGIAEPSKINEIVTWLSDELRPKEENKLTDFSQFKLDNKYSIRPMVFNLDDHEPRNNQKRFVYGELIIKYIWDCFRTTNNRQTCSITYPLNMWGHSLTPIVEYFKDATRDNEGTITDLYKHFKFK